MAPPLGNQGIYKITSPTGRVYVGQSVDIKTRFAKYRGLHCKGQRRLYASFKKHGVDLHDFDVIEVVQDINSLTERERFWQEHYTATGPLGLNCKMVTKSCHSGRHSDETKAKISASATGRKHTMEAKLKMSAAKIGRKMPEEQRKAMIGRVQSESQVEKRRKRMIGNTFTKGVVPVNARKVINTKTGEIFASITLAANELGYNPRTVRAWLDGQNKNKSALEVYHG